MSIKLKKLQTIVDKMAELGINSATIEYSGGGDEGEISEITVDPDVEIDKEKITLTSKRKMDIESALEEITWNLVYKHYEGFEIDDGGGGTLFIDVKSGTATLSHYSFGLVALVNVDKEISPSDDKKSTGFAISKIQNEMTKLGISKVEVNFSHYFEKSKGFMEIFAFSDTLSPKLCAAFISGSINKRKKSVEDFLVDLTENIIFENGMEGYDCEDGAYGSLSIPAFGPAKFVLEIDEERNRDEPDIVYSVTPPVRVSK